MLTVNGVGPPLSHEAGGNPAAASSVYVSVKAPRAAAPRAVRRRAEVSAPADAAPWLPKDDFEAVYRAHYPGLVRLARILGQPRAAEDVAQMAFLALLQSPGLRNPDAIGGFLRQCVVNKCRTDYRRRVLYQKLLPRLSDEREAAAPDDVQRLVVRDALHRLPRRQQEVLVLRYVADLSVAETAAVLGIAEGNVKATTHKGLQKLAVGLEAGGF